jgi:uncharacterized Tic20 family protein
MDDRPKPCQRFVDAAATADERTYAMVIHGSGAVSSVVALTTWGSSTLVFFFVPLVMWLVKRKESPFLDDHGKEAVNFQISLLVYTLAAYILHVICIGVILVPAISVLAVVGSSLGIAAAHRGEYFRYPACLRFLS